MAEESNFYDTVIVGAGFGGASAAYNLFEGDYKGRVLLLEARDRIGGRAYGRVVAGQHVEMGCNWIHGLENNPVSKRFAHDSPQSAAHYSFFPINEFLAADLRFGREIQAC